MAEPPRRKSLVTARTSTLAVWSFVLGLIGLCGVLFAIAAIICGHLGRARLARSAGRLSGGGFALTGLILGYGSVAMWAVIGWFFIQYYQEQQLVRERDTIAVHLAETPVPAFPELPPFSRLEPSEVRVCQFQLPLDDEQGGRPGFQMSFRIYLPAREAAPKSLPCVLVAPAGTNLLSGADLDDLDEFAYHDEALPYAEAGIAAVLYSIDGQDPSEELEDETAKVEAMKKAYLAFKAAGAGVVNGRDALELVLARLPEVDPARIYSAGHSSAATLSLLLGAHEPRLAGSLAYAPATDLEAHFGDLLTGFQSAILFPDLRRFARDSSPVSHLDTLDRPVFLFFADDDRLVSPASAKAFTDRIQAINPGVTVKTVERGGHYQSMIGEGIPAGIEWILSQPAK
ncbi:MAG: DUF4190 domain-containing protein [Verrucomicrobiae bacterium]|nr:DUF4190 domain-containing protein [Verrucomicrobiae bacterium]